MNEDYTGLNYGEKANLQQDINLLEKVIQQLELLQAIPNIKLTDVENVLELYGHSLEDAGYKLTVYYVAGGLPEFYYLSEYTLVNDEVATWVIEATRDYYKQQKEKKSKKLIRSFTSGAYQTLCNRYSIPF